MGTQSVEWVARQHLNEKVAIIAILTYEYFNHTEAYKII